MTGVHDDAFVEQVRAGGGDRDLLAQALGMPALDPAVQLAQRAQGRRAADPVRDEAVLPLEGA